MKETTRTIHVKAHTDGDGKPVCGACPLWGTFGFFCHGWTENESDCIPGPSCPVWYGESKGDISAIIGEIANNQEMFIYGGAVPQEDANEPRFKLVLAGPERVLKRLVDLIWEWPQESNYE